MIRSADTSRVIHSDPGFIRRYAFSGVRVLHVSKAVPHEPTDVELVVQNAGATLRVPIDRARAPGTAEWTANAFSIQVLCDLLRRNSRNEVAEDPLDDQRLGRFDLALARRDVPAA